MRSPGIAAKSSIHRATRSSSHSARRATSLASAVEAQQALGRDPTLPSVLIGIHTGEASQEDGRYVGVAVHRAQRICAAGHGGQVILSSATREVVEDDLPPGVEVRDLGE